MNNNNSKKENRSMYLYTALIFVVALLLILVAFFSQTNISKLGKRADEFATKQSPAPATSQTTNTEELAKIANMVPALEKENETLKTENETLNEKLTLYDNLLIVNKHIISGNMVEAKTAFDTIDETKLSDDQRILYDDFKVKIEEYKTTLYEENITNEGEEQ